MAQYNPPLTTSQPHLYTYTHCNTLVQSYMTSLPKYHQYCQTIAIEAINTLLTASPADFGNMILANRDEESYRRQGRVNHLGKRHAKRNLDLREEPVGKQISGNICNSESVRY